MEGIKIKPAFAVGIALLASLCLAGSALATTASMDLTSPGSSVTGTNVLNNAYVGAYTANINGVPTPVICDDFSDDSFVPETWTANVSTFSNLSGGMWYSSTNPSQSTLLYEEAAYLVEQMYANASNSTAVGDIQFAIWDLFNSGATAGLSSADLTRVNAWLAAASNPSNLASVNFGDFTIYTPIEPTDAQCPGYPNSACPSTPPQEFITYSAAEPSFIALLGVDLALFGCALLFLRRRRAIAA